MSSFKLRSMSNVELFQLAKVILKVSKVDLAASEGPGFELAREKTEIAIDECHRAMEVLRPFVTHHARSDGLVDRPVGTFSCFGRVWTFKEVAIRSIEVAIRAQNAAEYLRSHAAIARLEAISHEISHLRTQLATAIRRTVQIGDQADNIKPQ